MIQILRPVIREDGRPPHVRPVAGERHHPPEPYGAPVGGLYLTIRTYEVFIPVLFFIAGALLEQLPRHPMKGPNSLAGGPLRHKRFYLLSPTGAHAR
jgi:hypothetical protein